MLGDWPPLTIPNRLCAPFAAQSRAVKRKVIQRLRVLGAIEGVSFLLLLGVAMPLKYGFGHAHATFWPGLAHGILFLIFCAALAHAKKTLGKPPSWAVKFSIAAPLPFGPFVMDKGLKHDLDEIDSQS